MPHEGGGGKTRQGVNAPKLYVRRNRRGNDHGCGGRRFPDQKEFQTAHDAGLTEALDDLSASAVSF